MSSQAFFYIPTLVFVGRCMLCSDCRMNLLCCHCDPNGQHLAFWLSFLFFLGVGRVGRVGEGVERERERGTVGQESGG